MDDRKRVVTPGREAPLVVLVGEDLEGVLPGDGLTMPSRCPTCHRGAPVRDGRFGRHGPPNKPGENCEGSGAVARVEDRWVEIAKRGEL